MLKPKTPSLRRSKWGSTNAQTSTRQRDSVSYLAYPKNRKARPQIWTLRWLRGSEAPVPGARTPPGCSPPAPSPATGDLWQPLSSLVVSSFADLMFLVVSHGMPHKGTLSNHSGHFLGVVWNATYF